MWAPGFIHFPSNTGVEDAVPVTITSAPLTACSAVSHAVAPISSVNFCAFAAVLLQTLTCLHDNGVTTV